MRQRAVAKPEPQEPMSGRTTQANAMGRFVGGLRYDVSFVRGHRLQPGWYKALKVVLLLAAVGAYLFLFGPVKTAVFAGVFLVLSLVIHLVYRAGTDRFTRTWLDFRVEERDGTMVPVSIGRFYYSAIAISAAVAVAVSQLAGLT
jgi:hypothetical protein